MGIKIIVQCSGALVIIKTMVNDINENTRFTTDEKTLDNGKIYFGTYTLFITDLFAAMEFNEELVASLKNPNTRVPDNKYTGKLGIFLAKSKEKTMVITSIVINGLRIDHKTPKTLRL